MPAPADPDLAQRLATRTLELVDIPSESRREAEIAAYVEDALGPPTWRDGETLWYGADEAAATVRPRASSSPVTSTPCPPRTTCPGTAPTPRSSGLGASDMKAGVAVMVELARRGAT